MRRGGEESGTREGHSGGSEQGAVTLVAASAVVPWSQGLREEVCVVCRTGRLLCVPDPALGSDSGGQGGQQYR